MNWRQVCELEILKDAPFKVQTDKWGNIMMTPASNKHGLYQVLIGSALKEMSKGRGGVISECSIQTKEGVKVPDVVWGSPDFFEKNKLKTPYPSAPEICVEILSRNNTKAEILEKKHLYFERGAREVWICDRNGVMDFYDVNNRIESSVLFPKFPKSIPIDSI